MTRIRNYTVTENFRRCELSFERFTTFFLFSDFIHKKALYQFSLFTFFVFQTKNLSY